MDGKIVEAGTHESLLERDGMYRDLFEKQGQLEEKTESLDKD